MQGLFISRPIDQQGVYITKRIVEFLSTEEGNKLLMDLDYIKDENNDSDEILFYEAQAKYIRIMEDKTLMINIQHIHKFDTTGELLEPIVTEYPRFETFINQAVQEFMVNIHKDWALNRKFWVGFYNVQYLAKIRELRSNFVGKLICICGTVTRSSEVRPELIYGHFTCKLCNSANPNIDQQFRFTEPKVCINPNCNNKSEWDLNYENSVFADWQKLKLQENPSDIPTGAMPRSIDVILRNELVEKCKPGDKLYFTGCLQVIPDIISLIKPGEKIQHQLKVEQVRKTQQRSNDGVSGLKELGLRDLSYKLLFVAQHVRGENDSKISASNKGENKLTSKEIQEKFTEKELNEIIKIKQTQNLYSKLAKCISPSIYGQDDIKRGVLLMLFGGTNKTTSDGIKLRGDINLCIVGDPSTAKSQFLKFVCNLVPRSVYTSGKGSSAAGLTASVGRDLDSGEFCIEPGALMLADGGICCIDEFDKMDNKDQVAIHEAMEQQTISIAKAGINTTLNAKTSIFAAANPTLGRYDKTKNLKYNINITAPIMSRFDLFFVILDEGKELSDYNIASHIVNLHLESSLNSEEFKPFIDQKSLQLYLRFARHFKPKFTKEAAVILKEEFISLRQGEIGSKKSAYRITIRQLESLIRLSEALAKVHLDENILPIYVKEASRLLKQSILEVDMPDVELDDFQVNLQKERDHLEHENKKQMMEGKEYELLKTGIKYFIRQAHEQSAIVTWKDVIEWMIQEHFKNIESEEEASILTNKLNGVITHLIYKENVIIIVDEEDENKEDKDKILTLNPNYNNPDTY